MKRFSSSTKENPNHYGLAKLQARKKPLGHHPHTLTHNHSFFPVTHSEVNTPSPFYQTLNSNNFITPASIRPESKQSYRKQFSRPETSKGSREYLNKKGDLNQRSQHLPETHINYDKDEEESNIEIIVTRSRLD